MRRRGTLTLLAAAACLLGGGLIYLYLSGRLDWPLPLRYSDAAFADPTLSAQVARSLWMIAGALLAGGALIAGGVFAQQLRAWMMVVGAAAIVGGVVTLSPLLVPLAVEAFPTTYYRSPTGYSAASIMQGAAHYATHCAACHGRQGRGDGPGGRFLRVKPSNLTADHVYSHTDGDLYWWITHGIRDVMPEFGVALDESARWSVIDFVRANADAARLSQAPAKVTHIGYPAPDFFAACPDQTSMARGRIMHLVVGGKAERMTALTKQRKDGDVATVQIVPSSETTICRSDRSDLMKALAFYRGGGPIDGIEFLLDGAGLIRAMWYPGGRPNWSVPDELDREIAAIRDNPPASRPRGAHHAR